VLRELNGREDCAISVRTQHHSFLRLQFAMLSGNMSTISLLPFSSHVNLFPTPLIDLEPRWSYFVIQVQSIANQLTKVKI